MVDLQALEKSIYANIPIAEAFGARLLSASGESVRVGAPLSRNINHKSTAFGGSVYSIAVLSCWALINEALKERSCDVDYVVIQDGQMDYVTPVNADFQSQSSWPSPKEKEKFFNTLLKKGRARATLIASVQSAGFECARLQARFAAQIRRPHT